MAESYMGVSPYAYASNNPIKNIDLLGLRSYNKQDPPIDPDELMRRDQSMNYLFGSGGSWGSMGMNPGFGRFSVSLGPDYDAWQAADSRGSLGGFYWHTEVLGKSVESWKKLNPLIEVGSADFEAWDGSADGSNPPDGYTPFVDEGEKPGDPPSVGMIGRQVMEPMKGFWDYFDYFLNGRYYDGYKVGADGKIISNYRIVTFDVSHNAVSLLIGGGGSKTIIKGTQLGLRDIQVARNIMKAMLDGTYDYRAARGIISGFKDLNGIFYISEGHHRIAAAMEIYRTTGNFRPLTQLLQNGIWRDVAHVPSGARPLPSLSSWGRFRNWLGF